MSDYIVQKKLIRIDKNGSKYFEGVVKCDRCGGQGSSDVWRYTGYTCYKCGGTGQVFAKWIERTPEYQAKLDARRLAKRKAEIEAANARMEEEQKQRELAEKIRKEEEEKKQEQIKSEKAISQYVGEAGQKIEVNAIFDHTAWYEFKLGWKDQTMYIHTFKDMNGNKLVWKTSSRGSLGVEKGETVVLLGTIKDHSIYNDEKQTSLVRCKVKKAGQE